MKYASEDLVNEHKEILTGLKILEKLFMLLDDNKEVEAEDIKGIVNFLKLFADKCHHGKEEGILFPSMEKAGIQNENGPIGELLSEHVQGRKYVAQMLASVDGEPIKTDDFIQAASAYISLLRAHIIKENTVVFPMGDKLIPVEEQRQLLEQFEEFEETVMGKGTHEKLHEMLHEFKDKYL
ncbi:hemerythrin HHE cation binding domain protein [Peptoclostridium acidaminophilum DSM 3953]|uniref:Hemerythrin HHE cation binding domain protein n=1 Tax=Peptoclostridium acidaminophilum DSM 3953 TaxID=1286171 RepID=W8TE35_PEPAC|nr:hemerythrin domain-containing protein [Peptoclostridium acidaminophilum]AHM56088.1 hemerythrin HHE cation binding domain protein [Peptoclostridium acidaminophilum DSM 3953]